MKKDHLQIKIEDYAIKMGNNIMHIRMSKDISLSTASFALGIPLYVLKNIEDGKSLNVKVSLLFKLVKYYDVEMKDLFQHM